MKYFFELNLVYAHANSSYRVLRVYSAIVAFLTYRRKFHWDDLF